MIVLFLIVAALAVHPQAAAAQKFTAYQTGIKVQNLSDVQALITVEYIALGGSDGSGGNTIDSVSDDIDPGSSNTYYPLPVTNFSGSVVISSSQPVASIVNVGNSAGTAWGSYVGRGEGGTSVYLPLLHKNNGGYDSWFSVQNTSLTDDANVNVDYSDCGAAVDASAVIAPNASVIFYQKNETCHTSPGFGAIVTSTNNIPIVAVGMQESATNILTYTGFDSGSLLPRMPLLNFNNSKYHSGIQVLNPSASTATDVTITYSPSMAGTACTETKTINPGQVGVFGLYAFMNTNQYDNCIDGERFIGSAAVTSNTNNVPLVAVVNQIRIGFAPAGSYSAFDPDQATNTIKLPIIMDRLGGFYTGFSVANVGTGTAHVKCTFTGTTKTVDSGTAGIAAGQALTHIQSGYFSPSYSGAGTCVAYTNNTFATPDTNAKIVAVVNELGSGAGDALMVYEGITP